jgi:hypothetical protein
MKKVEVSKSCVVLVSLCMLVVMLVGCQRVPLPGETSYKKSDAGPLYCFEKIEGVNEDGSTWKINKGNAVCWLSYWDKEKIYDKDGFLIEAKEKEGFFPIWSSELVQDKEFREHNASFLIFPYESRRTSVAGSEK